MPDSELQIITSGLPDGLCYTNPSDDLPIFVQYLRALFSGNEINIGSSTPAAADRTKPWIRINSDGTDDGVWQFFGGYWIQKHPMAQGMVICYEGTLTDLPTFDGGESAAVTNISGPFWEEVTAMQARSPIHPGTLTSGTVINVGDNIGEEKHIMTATELISHTHVIKTFSAGSIDGDGGHILNEPDPASDVDHTTEATGSDPPDGMNNIQPSRGIYFIRRTARLYRRRPG